MANWNLDASHSEIEFKVRHMMISTVKGSFTSFDVKLTTESEDLKNSSIEVSIDIESINTKNEQRDQHLKSGDFFNVAEFPKITFQSTAIEQLNEEEFKVTGDLTVKGVTKSITFDAELGGVAKDPWGNLKAGYTIKGAINRADFDLSWNAALETGGVMVSEEVKFTADVQFVKS